MTNPLLEKPRTAFGIPDFGRLRDEHFEPAYTQALAQQQAEILAIVDQASPPDFANTIVALEESGRLLRDVDAVFSNLASSNSNAVIRKLEVDLAARLADQESAIYSNPALYSRVEQVLADSHTLQRDQQLLVERYHRRFIKAGAALEERDRQRLATINAEIAQLKVRFQQNVLEETGKPALMLRSREEVAGLPEDYLASAAAEASRIEAPDSWVVTISRSSFTPFMQYARRRDLREQLYRAYTGCCAAHGETGNAPVLRRLADLRAQRAVLLGYRDHAACALEDRMAGSEAAVRRLLDEVRVPAWQKLQQELADLQALADEDGLNDQIRPWDWWYYTEKLRASRFAIDPDELKAYFSLDRVRDGAFEVARRLYGLTFHVLPDAPRYHPDVDVYEVRDANGEHIGVFMTDFYMRSGKRGGAWMSELRSQRAGAEIRPIVLNNCNFRPGDPCLLSLEEVSTLFHEFGHGLHGLLSNVRYESQAGTNVRFDFVELPSQIMEHWAIQPDVLREYARHYRTGEVIPERLIDAVRAAATFNEGFATAEYLAACYLDLAWHTLHGAVPEDVQAFERAAMESIELPDVIAPRYRSTYFQHAFSSDAYSAGYYVYLWAAVLDADAFDAFSERGIFDAATARDFRSLILERGGSEEPMTLYRQFRGRDPSTVPLLRHRGLIEEDTDVRAIAG